jgi:hypothetical protein
MGGLICFLLKKEDVLRISGYSPVCLLDTVYKVFKVITDRLNRLVERHRLLEGFCRLYYTQRQVQSLLLAIQDAAEGGETFFCCYLDFVNVFDSVDHAVLWRWLRELNVPDMDLLQSLVSLLLQVVADSDFCSWPCMWVKREKSVATCFEFQKRCHCHPPHGLGMEGILYACRLRAAHRPGGRRGLRLSRCKGAAWRLPPGYPSALLVFPSSLGALGCPEAHQREHWATCSAAG